MGANLNIKPSHEYQLQKIPARNVGRISPRHRPPFWLPASGYYMLTAAVVIAFFFLIWGFLQEGGEESPWIPAGVCVGFMMGGAVFLREIVLRKARDNYAATQRRLDFNLKSIPLQSRNVGGANKLTVEKNAEIIKKIRQKSEAAKVLGKLADGHWEVFEICNEYLRVNQSELENVGIGSPRIAALRRGRDFVQDLHRYHLLLWAEIESRSLTRDAKNRVVVSDKLEIAHKALSVLDSALQFYPNDRRLTESEAALKEFIASIKVSDLIEQGERSAFKGNYKQAINHYKDALYFLARENVSNTKKDSAAERINQEIENLREMAEKKKQGIIIKKTKKENK